jgi:hypothetical protein
MSSLLKYLASFNWSMTSLIKGNGVLSFMEISFNFW